MASAFPNNIISENELIREKVSIFFYLGACENMNLEALTQPITKVNCLK